MSEARVEQVIITSSVVGKGTAEDNVRRVTEIYSFDGRLIGTQDPCAPKYNECTGRWEAKSND